MKAAPSLFPVADLPLGMAGHVREPAPGKQQDSSYLASSSTPAKAELLPGWTRNTGSMPVEGHVEVNVHLEGVAVPPALNPLPARSWRWDLGRGGGANIFAWRKA